MIIPDSVSAASIDLLSASVVPPLFQLKVIGPLAFSGCQDDVAAVNVTDFIPVFFM